MEVVWECTSNINSTHTSLKTNMLEQKQNEVHDISESLQVLRSSFDCLLPDFKRRHRVFCRCLTSMFTIQEKAEILAMLQESQSLTLTKRWIVKLYKILLHTA